MTKITCLTILLLSCFLYVNAQEVVATQGQSYWNTSGSIDFTLGEVIIATIDNGTQILTQGFQQPDFIVTKVNHPENYSGIKLYPNPVQEQLILELDIINETNYLVIINSEGKTILKQNIRQDQNIINFSSLPKGFYFLTVKNENQDFNKTFQIQKIK